MVLPEKIGKYEIESVLGQGGMGVVYKGYDHAIARHVAIKAITKAALAREELEQVIARFRHEAQAVGRLVHPRIVQIYDYGEDDNLAYIVMEMVNGVTLAQHLSRGDAYDLRASAEIIRQLLDGMGHAHAEGVIHRDLKPSNILVNSDGRIKISDFGIARTEASGLTQSGEVIGTLHYMSPEQFAGLEVDAVTDLYSIAVIAYELLAGKKPFSGSAATVMRQVLSHIPDAPSHPNPKLSPLVDRVLLKALAKSREDRFQTAREFSDAFREAIDASLAMAGEGAAAAVTAPTSAALLSAARLLAPAPRASSGVSPIVDAADMTVETAIKLDRSVKKGRILFVDDEERILSALKSQFRERYHVFTTTDGNKALEFLSKYQMHVIVSDQRMPTMVGVELLRQAKEMQPNSVRILLTGYSDLAAIVGSINDGEVYRFISKPWDNAELQNIVAEAMTIGLELADTRVGTLQVPEPLDAGILVVDQDEELFRALRELMGSVCPVVHAPDLDGAMTAMQSQEIAVVIADVAFGQYETIAMLKLLKQENPQILSLVVTQASDSEMVIELINQAQIFRFLNKPVNLRLLRGHLTAALQRYLAYRATPQLVSTQKVEVKQEVRASSVGVRMLDGLRSLRGRWFGKSSP